MSKFFSKVVGLIIVALSLSFIILLVSSQVRFWLFELYVSFAPYVLKIGLTVFLISILGYFYLSKTSPKKIIRSKKVVLPAIGFISALIFVTTNFNTANGVGSSLVQSDLTIATYNKLILAPEMDKAVDYFKSKNVDVVFLQEIFPEEANELAERLNFEYTFFSKRSISAGGSDVAIISRYELLDEQAYISDEENKRGIIGADIEVGSRRIALYNSHITPPFTNDWYWDSNNELDFVKNLLISEELPVIFGGDLNITHYSPVLKDFAKDIGENGINRTDASLFAECSWYLSDLLPCLRIDHFYADETMDLNFIDISPELESDHRAVTVGLDI